MFEYQFVYLFPFSVNINTGCSMENNQPSFLNIHLQLVIEKTKIARVCVYVCMRALKRKRSTSNIEH